MKYLKFLLFINVLYNTAVNSQKPIFHGTFYGFADNREYFCKYAKAQTILGTRADLNAEFSDLDSVNKVFLGINFLYEFGYTINGNKPALDLYYHYNKGIYDFYFGAFPRKHLLNYPLVLLTDTLLYYRPNIEGALGQINGERGDFKIWIDWTGRQTDTVKEAFLAGLSGKMNINLFYFEEYFYMYHLAHAANRTFDTIPIRDNGGGAVFLGVDLSEKIILDKLVFDIGTVFSYDRYRPDPYLFANGFISRLKTQYKRIGLDGIFYNGAKQSLAYGDPFYSGGKYSRIDCYFIPIQLKNITSKIKFGFHIAEDDFNVSQQIFINIKFL